MNKGFAILTGLLQRRDCVIIGLARGRQLKPLGPFVFAVDVDAHAIEDRFLEGLRLAVFQVGITELGLGRLKGLLVLGRGNHLARIAKLKQVLLSLSLREVGEALGVDAVGDIDGV